MRDLRKRYNPIQREEFQVNINVLHRYVTHVLKERQGDLCARCNEPATKYDIDHKLYNPMITIEHLQLLCIPCHKEITNYIPFRNR